MKAIKPTICIADPHYIGEQIGGAEVQMYILAKGLLKQGWRVIHASDCLPDSGQDEGIELVALQKQNIEQQLVDLVEREGVDIFYQRGRKAYTCHVAKAARKTGIPYVYAYSMDLDYKKHKFLFRHMHSPKQIVKHLMFSLRDFMLDINSAAAIRNANQVFFQTEHQRDESCKRTGKGGLLIRNLHRLPAAEEINKAEKLRVLWLATIKEWKRPELYLNVARELKDLPVEFVIAGNLKHKKYKEDIDALVAENPQFRYEPCNDLEKSNELIAGAHIFVNTSMGEEGFPNTFIQSWLRNTLVISASFDPDNLLQNSGLGVLKPADSTLAETVREVAENYSDYDKVRDTAYEFAADTFSMEHNIERISGELQRLIQGAGR